MKALTVFVRILSLGGWLSAVLLSSCSPPEPAPEPEEPLQVVEPLGAALTGQSADLALQWGAMSLRMAARTPGNTPTYASRAFGYLGLTMYETSVYGIPNRKSLVRQVTGLRKLPQPKTGLTYDWELSLNAGQAYILKQLYEHTLPINKLAIDSLETAVLASRSVGKDTAVVNRSVVFGRQVAEAIFAWSKTDGGHRGYENPFPMDYNLPSGPGFWVPPADGQVAIRRALHPHWGKNRTFAPANLQLATPRPAAFSIDPKSDYYALYRAVYEKGIVLTQEEKAIVLWWGDDPSETFTPPGHSYYLAGVAIRTTKADLAKAVETYARVGMAVADAFITCWKTKYTYHNERPSGFIRTYITFWTPYFPEPPFPGYPSGHASQSAAAATVLTDLYGDGVAFTDDAHVGRHLDPFRGIEYKARQYKSFWETAEESAHSRFLGGIHTRQDNDTGLREGKKVGEAVNGLFKD